MTYRIFTWLWVELYVIDIISLDKLILCKGYFDIQILILMDILLVISVPFAVF